MLNDLKSKIPDLFQNYLQENYEKNNIQLEILNFDEAIDLKNVQYFIDKDLIGQNIDGFEGKIKADIYAKAISKKDLENILNTIIENKTLKDNGIIIIHRHKKEIDKFPKNFQLIDEKKYGISKIIFGNIF